jgi:hypothetical protein
MTISKSKFVAGWQCLKRLYFIVHEPDLTGDVEATDLAIMQQGREVGELARGLFPGGVVVKAGGLAEAIRTTRELVANPEVPAIFEGAFEDSGVYVRVDILQRRKDNRFRLIEVKSSASLKDEHLPDVAIQAHVVCQSGIDLASSFLAHINRGYVYPGGVIDPWRLFRIKNLTRRVEKLQVKVSSQLQAELDAISKPTPPDIQRGPQCTDPRPCEFYDSCNPPIPEDHISYLPRISTKIIVKLRELGVSSIRDIPDDYPLSERLRHACTSVQTGQSWFSSNLKGELSALQYPVCFMDFETVNPAIPRFPGMRPYDHIPFQWSVHVQGRPGEAPEHHEFLASDRRDPRREFIMSLCGALGQQGSIVVYNGSFESQRLSELAEWLPEFSEGIEGIHGRLWDLLPVVRDRVYHPVFAGSYSLKAVLPAFVPDMTYEGMDVADGQQAGLAWEAMVRGDADQPSREGLRKALLDYCGQDTLGLVRVLDKLRLIAT